MRCCVPMCNNDTRNTSKSQGITFHIFPNDPSLRRSWLKALGKEDWEPKKHNVICSEHFFSEDLYETRGGLMKVRFGAVPLVIQDTVDCNYGEPAALKVCRICLATDSKLFPIRVYKLEQAYEHLTGISFQDEHRLPQMLCVECAQRLLNFNQFRSRSLRANSCMMDLLKKEGNLTLQNIETIDRENAELISPLLLKHYEPDYYDNIYIYDEDPPVIAQDEQPPSSLDSDIEIMDEKEEFITEESKEETADLESDDYSDKDFVASDCNNSSNQSSDSLTLDDHKPNNKNEPLFTITDLTIEEQLAEFLKRQDSSNYKNAIFKCTSCYKGFLDETAYKNHIMRHTNELGKYECGICKLHFKHHHALRKHVNWQHTQRFSCNQCPYVTTYKDTAQLHERWHNGIKYTCPHCGLQFNKPSSYRGHLRIKHPSDFVCEICGYSFVSTKGLEQHKKLKHRFVSTQIPEDGPVCELCNVRFVSEEALRRHLNVSTKHETAKRETNEHKKTNRPRPPRIANESGRRHYTKNTQPGEPIPCEQCGVQLRDLHAYSGHFRRMHPDKNRTNYPSMKTPCMCEVCGKMFQSKTSLKDHTWTHTNERPFKCDVCGKSFRMKQRLVTHRHVHSAVRTTYECEICGKHFSYHSNRQRHMAIHTGLKPYKCEMCGKAFKLPREKRAHITYVHLKKPWPKRDRSKRKSEGQRLQQAQEMEVATPAPSRSGPKVVKINDTRTDKRTIIIRYKYV